MTTGYLDDSNNVRNNLVLHRSATTTGRGIPAVGKIVYRTDLGYAQVCTSTSPNATSNGGGTWDGVIPEGSVSTYTPDLRSLYNNSLNKGTTGTTSGYYTTVGDIVNASAYWAFGGTGCTFGTAGHYWTITVPVAIDSDVVVAGTGYAWDSSTSTHRLMLAYPYDGFGYTTGMQVRLLLEATGTTNYVAHATTPWTWAADDYLLVNLTYLAA